MKDSDKFDFYLNFYALATFIYLTHTRKEKAFVPVYTLADGPYPEDNIITALEQFIESHMDKFLCINETDKKKNMTIQSLVNKLNSDTLDIGLGKLNIKILELKEDELKKHFKKYLEAFRAGELLDRSNPLFLNYSAGYPQLLDIIDNCQKKHSKKMCGENWHKFAGCSPYEMNLRIFELLLCLEDMEFLSISNCCFYGQNNSFYYEVEMKKSIDDIRKSINANSSVKEKIIEAFQIGDKEIKYDGKTYPLTKGQTKIFEILCNKHKSTPDEFMSKSRLVKDAGYVGAFKDAFRTNNKTLKMFTEEPAGDDTRIKLKTFK